MSGSGFAGRLLAATLLTFAIAGEVAGQGVCTVNNQASCTVGGDATHSITITITNTARLSSPVSTVVLTQPTTTSFVNGFGVPVLVQLPVRSNVNWTVGINAGATLWNASPGSAWQTKPAGDLQWGLSSGGTFFDVTTTPVTVASGLATGTATVGLYLRVRFLWTSDVPGSYSLPVQFTLTAP